MKGRLYLFLTPDGVTYSSCEEVYPDVENFQVLGWAEGNTEEEAFEEFVKNNKWVLKTNFENVVCIEVRKGIHEGTWFSLRECKEQ